MCAISACMCRLGGAAALLGTILAVLAPLPAAAADGPIADPKIWCGDAAKMIADKDAEKFIDSFVFASGHGIDRPRAAQAFGGLAPALTQEGEFLSRDFLLEKSYGEAFSRIWFLVQFENGLLFMRCEGAKRGKGWVIVSVTYDNKSDNVHLP